MTTQEMHDWFDLIQDKYSSPYFTDGEKDSFLTRAQYQYINELFPDNEGGAFNIESDMLTLQNVSTLVYETTASLNMSSAGIINKANINTTLNSISGGTEPYIRILNVSLNNGTSVVPVRFRRHNDFYKLEKNSFKSASADVPTYRIISTGIKLAPINITYDVYFTLLKEPKKIQLGVTEPELPSNTHDKLVAIALELAGVSSRDEALMVMGKQ